MSIHFHYFHCQSLQLILIALNHLHMAVLSLCNQSSNILLTMDPNYHSFFFTFFLFCFVLFCFVLYLFCVFLLYVFLLFVLFAIRLTKKNQLYSVVYTFRNLFLFFIFLVCIIFVCVCVCVFNFLFTKLYFICIV